MNIGASQTNMESILAKDVFEHLNAFVLIANEMDEIIYKNSVASDVLTEGLIKEKLIKHSINPLLNSQNIYNQFEIEFNNKWYKVNDSTINWAQDCKARLMVGFEITEYKLSENQFKKIAKTDAMTSILNRQSGLDFLDECINELKNGGNCFTVCYLDINDLKYTNDTFGHSVGDQYIMFIVNEIKQAIRQTDIFARMGGDEFLVIFPKCRYEAANNIMATVVERLVIYNETQNVEPYFSISFGILEVNSESILDAEQILNVVDSKMYYMKEEYRNTLTRNSQPQ